MAAIKTIKRYQVRTTSKSWNDPGPDLLRQKDNARAALAGAMGHTGTGGWRWRRQKLDGTFTAWSREMSKPSVLDAFDKWDAADGKVFQIGKGKTSVRMKVAARTEVVKIVERGVDPGATLVSALMHHRFPALKFCGGFLCKRISGTWDWSDHSWKDAIDECAAPGASNDDVTDWTARMARSGCMTYAYLLGSRAGRVVKAVAPDFDLEPSTAAKTHLWHNHVSTVDHGGAKPPWC